MKTKFIFAFILGVGLWLTLTAVYRWYDLDRRTFKGAATDEKMIEHFYKHKTELEELVKRFREFDLEATKTTRNVWVHGNPGGMFDIEFINKTAWRDQGDTEQLFNRAGLSRKSDGIFPMGDSNWLGHNTIWLEKPYSIDSARIAEELENKAQKAMKKNQDLLFSNNEYNRYGMLAIMLEPEESFKKSGRDAEMCFIGKYLYHIPVAPRIENGELLGPYDVNGNYVFRWRLDKSLDVIKPEEWFFVKPECRVRLIEPQWYILVCHSRECTW